jgi:hypothetical protein
MYDEKILFPVASYFQILHCIIKNVVRMIETKTGLTPFKADGSPREVMDDDTTMFEVNSRQFLDVVLQIVQHRLVLISQKLSV